MYDLARHILPPSVQKFAEPFCLLPISVQNSTLSSLGNSTRMPRFRCPQFSSSFLLLLVSAFALLGFPIAAWAGVASYTLLKFVDAVVGLRVDEEEESSAEPISISGDPCCFSLVPALLAPSYAVVTCRSRTFSPHPSRSFLTGRTDSRIEVD